MSNEEMVTGLMNLIRDNSQLAARCRCKLKLWSDAMTALVGVMQHGVEHTTVGTPIGRGVRIAQPAGPRVIDQLPSVDEIATTLDDLRNAEEEITGARQTLSAMGCVSN